MTAKARAVNAAQQTPPFPLNFDIKIPQTHPLSTSTTVEISPILLVGFSLLNAKADAARESAIRLASDIPIPIKAVNENEREPPLLKCLFINTPDKLILPSGENKNVRDKPYIEDYSRTFLFIPKERNILSFSSTFS